MSAARRVVLIVLEGAEHRAHFNQVLAQEPHALVYSFDGADGFDRFLEARPDVIFVSELTTRISGNILCRLIREHRFGRGVGVFLMSPRASEGDAEARAAELGVDAVLPMPPSPAQILEHLEGGHAFSWDPNDAVELEEAGETPPPSDVGGEPLAAEAGENISTGQTVEQVTLFVQPPEQAEQSWPDRTEGDPAGVPESVELGKAASAALSEDTIKIPTMRLPTASSSGDGSEWRSPSEELTPVQLQASGLQPPPEAPQFDPPTLDGVVETVSVPPPPTDEVPAMAEQAVVSDPAVVPPDPDLAVEHEAVQREEATPVEEPTPVSESSSDVFASTQVPQVADSDDSGEVFASSVSAASGPDPTSTGFSTGGSDGDSFDASGIYPLAPEERDSDTLRRAITDSQLGSRLTRRILALYRLLDAVDYYQLLGVTADAEPAAIQEAFHGLAIEYHPDRFYALAQGLIKERVGALYRRISEGYSVLSSPERRQRYDAAMTEQGAGPPPRFLLGEARAPRTEDGTEANTPVGRKYLRLAFAALAREDLDAAHLNLTFALGHEPDNELLRQRLKDVERQLQEAQAPRA